MVLEGMAETFRSLKFRNFRLYFFAQMLSLMGSWVQGTAQSWLLWRLTGSEGLLGLLGFAQMGPVLVFGLAGGLLADKFDRKKLLLVTQSLALLQACALTALTALGMITPLHIFVLAAMLGTINAFDMTGRQTFLADMVGKEHLGNAIVLNSLLFNIARVIAPPIGGIVVAKYGETVCFGVNAASFVFVLTALFLIRLDREQDKGGGSALFSLKEAVLYFKNNSPQLRVLLVIMLASFFLLPYGYFLPFFADRILGGNARMLGFLMSSAGAGALIGALIMARIRKVDKLPYFLGVSTLSMAASLGLFSASRAFVLSVPLLFCAGFSTMVAASSCNIFLQTTAPEELRGRVVSFYVTSFIGFPPVGGLIAGSLAETHGTPTVMLGSAVLTFVAGTAYLYALCRSGSGRCG